MLFLFLCIHGLAMANGILVKEGTRGNDVRRVQLLLIFGGYLRGEADGVCGKDTVTAIKAFQESVGIEADGICGKDTFALLEKMTKDAQSSMGSDEEIPVGGVVKMGYRGPGVLHVQELLIAKGYLSGEADGVCGSRTAEAVARFQKDHGLLADGICGDATYTALQEDPRESHAEEASEENRKSPHISKGHVVYVSASAYSAYDPGSSSRTATGTRVRKGIIAVDPTFIPLGTRVFIPGYGEAVAEDIGHAIRGNRIDVAFDSYEEALAFGRQDVELYIIE